MINDRGGCTAAIVLMALVGPLLLAGCRGGGTPVPDDAQRYGTASRPQLMADLRNRMKQFYTYTAKAHVTMVDQSVTRGGRFATTDVNGELLLKREPDGSRQVRFSAQTFLPPARFTFLERNEKFWIVMPDFSDEDAADGKKGTVYRGKVRRDETRPRKTFSYRPQDIGDVFLVDEAFDPYALVYMETWEAYYILNFLSSRQDRQELICSKIWISRIDGNMVVHQIFDASGELLVEGRFGEYRDGKSQVGDFSVPLPGRFSVIWPRDKLALHAELENAKLNIRVYDTVFEPEEPETYRIFERRDDRWDEMSPEPDL